MAPRYPLHKAKTYPPTSAQTYSIAHTAQCKLSMAADAPDRNLRFLLGHAITLDNALVRIVEIESDSSSSDEEAAGGDKTLGVDIDAEGQSDALTSAETAGKSGSLARGKVKFGGETSGDEKDEKNTAKQGVPAEPDAAALADYGDDEDDEGMGLTRFASASAAPPRMMPDTGDDSDEDENEPISPPTLPSDFDYNGLMQEPEDEGLGKLYEEVRSCPCHGQEAVKGKKMWNVTTPEAGGKKLAVMEIEA